MCVVEYDAVSRLGISEPRTFIEKRFKGDSLKFLESCCIGQAISDRIEAEVDEAIAGDTWIDIQVRYLACIQSISNMCIRLIN